MTVLTVSAEIFACHSAACRPPTSGGTGGSGGGGGSKVRAFKANAPRANAAKVSADTAQRRALRKANSDALAKVDWSKGAGPSIKNGEVHVDGKSITGKITKRGGQYWASMKGSQHQITRYDGTRTVRQVTGKTRKEMMDAAHKLHLEDQARASVDWAARRASSRSMSQTDLNRIGRLSESTAQQVRGLGKTAPSKISIGRDGTPSVNGKKAPMYKIRKSSAGVYHIDGVESRSGEYSRPRVFKTHAAVKAYIAKEINAYVAYGG